MLIVPESIVLDCAWTGDRGVRDSLHVLCLHEPKKFRLLDARVEFDFVAGGPMPGVAKEVS